MLGAYYLAIVFTLGGKDMSVRISVDTIIIIYQAEFHRPRFTVGSGKYALEIRVFPQLGHPGGVIGGREIVVGRSLTLVRLSFSVHIDKRLSCYAMEVEGKASWRKRL